MSSSANVDIPQNTYNVHLKLRRTQIFEHRENNFFVPEETPGF